MQDRVIRSARRSRSGAVLQVNVRTILPSGPLAAIASFGSSEGHSLSVGSPELGSWTRRNRDTHLRTDCAPAPCDDSLFVQFPNREVAYALRSDSMARRCRSGSYSSPSFHIRKPVAAMMRASVQVAACTSTPMYRSTGASSRWRLFNHQLEDLPPRTEAPSPAFSVTYAAARRGHPLSSSPGQSPTPGPLQIRTRRCPPSGSSADAARGYEPQIRTVIRGRGSGKSRSRSANRSHVRRLR